MQRSQSNRKGKNTIEDAIFPYKGKKTVERVRIDVCSSVHAQKEILKEYLTSVVEKRGNLVDGKRLGKRIFTVYFFTFCFMKQGKVFSVQKHQKIKKNLGC